MNFKQVNHLKFIQKSLYSLLSIIGTFCFVEPISPVPWICTNEPYYFIRINGTFAKVNSVQLILIKTFFFRKRTFDASKVMKT